MLLLAEGIEWYNYPGLELWKFINLAIFTAAGIYVLRKPINQALAIIKGTKNERGARQFSEFVLSPEGRAVLSKYGFEFPRT